MFGEPPNITGKFSAVNGRYATGDSYFQCEGAFALSGEAGSKTGNADGGGGGGRLELKASRSSTLYGAANAVQPPSIVQLAIIKI